MDISAWLDRIGYQGPRLPTRQVLFDVHLTHLRAIPYENLDIHLGRTLGDPLRKCGYFSSLHF